jgi:hypothetical protein
MTIGYPRIDPDCNDAGRLERLLRSVPIACDDIEMTVGDDCSRRKTQLRGKDLPAHSWNPS